MHDQVGLQEHGELFLLFIFLLGIFEAIRQSHLDIEVPLLLLDGLIMTVQKART